MHISFQSVHFAIAEYSSYDGKAVGIDALFGPSREGRHFLRNCASSLIKT